jgi:GxxExxY protein
MKPDELTRKVIGCAHEVYRALGPGLLESTYRECLARELCINHNEIVGYRHWIAHQLQCHCS